MCGVILKISKMKNILIGLMVAVILFQSFSLHKCKCKISAVFYYNKKHIYTWNLKDVYWMTTTKSFTTNKQDGSLMTWDSVIVKER